jgi:hypothetical protein
MYMCAVNHSNYCIYDITIGNFAQLMLQCHMFVNIDTIKFIPFFRSRQYSTLYTTTLKAQDVFCEHTAVHVHDLTLLAGGAGHHGGVHLTQ